MRLADCSQYKFTACSNRLWTIRRRNQGAVQPSFRQISKLCQIHSAVRFFLKARQIHFRMRCANLCLRIESVVQPAFRQLLQVHQIDSAIPVKIIWIEAITGTAPLIKQLDHLGIHRKTVDSHLVNKTVPGPIVGIVAAAADINRIGGRIDRCGGPRRGIQSAVYL